MYVNLVTDPPEAFVSGAYHKVILHKEDYAGKNNHFLNRYFNEMICHKKIAKELISYITSHEETDNEFSVVVFHDNYIIDCILIEKLRELYPRAKCILVEEGLALYASMHSCVMTIKKRAKNLINRMIGVPSINVMELPHGYNPLIDMIICARPELLLDKVKGRDVSLLKETDIFTRVNCEYFITEILGLKLPEKKYDYVFLTQPLFPVKNPELNTKYEKYLQTVFSIIIRHGTLLIKQHPHDSWDYSSYRSDMIDISDERTTCCPFECLMGFYGNPRTVTLYSSAGCSLPSGKTNIFMYDFFPEIIRTDIFSDEFINSNNITRCKDYEQLNVLLGSES